MHTQTCNNMRMYVDVSMDWQICTYLSISGQDIIRREKCVNSQARTIHFLRQLIKLDHKRIEIGITRWFLLHKYLKHPSNRIKYHLKEEY